MYKFVFDLEASMRDYGGSSLKTTQVTNEIVATLSENYLILRNMLMSDPFKLMSLVTSVAEDLNEVYHAILMYSNKPKALSRNLKQAYEVKCFDSQTLVALAFSEVAKIQTYRSHIQVAGAVYRAVKCLKTAMEKYTMLVPDPAKHVQNVIDNLNGICVAIDSKYDVMLEE